MIIEKSGNLKKIEVSKKKLNIIKFTSKLVPAKKIKSPNPKKNSNECCIPTLEFLSLVIICYW